MNTKELFAALEMLEKEKNAIHAAYVCDFIHCTSDSRRVLDG